MLPYFHLDPRASAGVDLRRGIHDDEPGQLLRVFPPVEHGYASSQGVSDEDEAIDRQRFAYALEIGDEMLVLVFAMQCPGGVSMAALIEGKDAVVGSDRWREVVPDMRVVSKTVNEKKSDALGAPLKEVKIESVRATDAP